MSDMPSTELMLYWDSLAISRRVRNALLRYYYRATHTDQGWRWKAQRPDTVDQFLADLAFPFELSPLRYVRNMGVTMYVQLQRAKTGAYVERWHGACPRAKLSAQDVQLIRSLYASKEATQRDLAHRFNVSQATIGLIVNNKIWKYTEQASTE